VRQRHGAGLETCGGAIPADRAEERPLIWIVDDSPTQAAFTEASLGSQYRYERFGDGASVIERATAALPDLLLLDWVMPGLSGDEVCRHLRQLPATRELPIVILTASRTATEDIVCALESGANDYVAKPFAQAELHARVGTILRAAELGRAAHRERTRLSAMNTLAQALLQAETVDAILDVMSQWLVSSVGDGCVLSLSLEDGIRRRSLHRDARGTARLDELDDLATGVHVLPHTAAASDNPRPAHVFVTQLQLRGIATLRAVLARGPSGSAFDARDVLMIDSCLDYSSLAIEAALRSERERATTRFHEEMVGIVGHDLRGPLSALGLGLGLLGQSARDAASVDTLARLQRSSVRMNHIVAQLLDVTRARIGSGIPIAPRPMLLRELVAAVLDELRLAQPTVQFQLDGSEVEGSWDRDRMGQVVANLAGNAAQYGRPGSAIRVIVSASDGSAHLLIHNENRDQAIPEEKLKLIFDPFERGRTNGVSEGLGLGLYIVQQIVRAHRGTITVKSDDTGTTFRVSLPIVPE
jgi:sigma-B regulation protein RsbU (phosphoserine phosphatase)